MRRIAAVAALLMAGSCADAPGRHVDASPDAGGDGDADEPCSNEGDVRCLEEGVAGICRGGFWVREECEHICSWGAGCALCHPASPYCADDGVTVMQCSEDGQEAAVASVCEGGLRCDRGRCVETCESAARHGNSTGCEFWAVDLDMPESYADTSAAAPLALLLSYESEINTGDSSIATVETDRAAPGEEPSLEVVAQGEVGSGVTTTFLLPRLDVDGQGSALGRDDDPQTGLSRRSFRVTTSEPVAAVQLNPGERRYSSDASLLLAWSSLGTEYLVLGYPAASSGRAYVTVVGTRVGTTVTVRPTFRILAGDGVGPVARGEDLTVELDPFDVLNLETDPLTGAEVLAGTRADLTGTTVVADAPVAVFSGADRALVVPGPEVEPEGVCCADHIEAQLYPVSAWGTSFVASPSPREGGVDVYRVLSAHDGTHVESTLEAELAAFDLDRGEWREMSTDRPFALEADRPVAVAQLLVSRDLGGGEGDPAMLLLPPVSRWSAVHLVPAAFGVADVRVVAVTAQGQGVGPRRHESAQILCEPFEALEDLSGAALAVQICTGGVTPGRAVGLDSYPEVPFQVLVYGISPTTAHAYASGLSAAAP